MPNDIIKYTQYNRDNETFLIKIEQGQDGLSSDFDVAKADSWHVNQQQEIYNESCVLVTNERARKVDCAIWWPMRDQRSRSRPGNVAMWKNLHSVIMAMNRGRLCLCQYAKYWEISRLWGHYEL